VPDSTPGVRPGQVWREVKPKRKRAGLDWTVLSIDDLGVLLTRGFADKKRGRLDSRVGFEERWRLVSEERVELAPSGSTRSIFGESSDPLPTSCRIVLPSLVEMHWYTSFEAGAPCLCGKRTYRTEEEEKQADV